tara:strand:- start:2599 stop:2826 length:228 start_codon:yes stop_codon:yes gene_type:complete
MRTRTLEVQIYPISEEMAEELRPSGPVVDIFVSSSCGEWFVYLEVESEEHDITNTVSSWLSSNRLKPVEVQTYNG